MKKFSLFFIPTLCFLATLASAQAPQKPEPASAPEKEVRFYRDLAYVPDGRQEHKLDLYVPSNPGGALPLLVWIHGGGWRFGDKQNCRILPWTRKGYAVASINYRLCERAKFPAQIEDCRAAILWLKDHADAYRIDPDRVAVWGSSAGGHLAALIGTTGDLSEVQKAGSCRVKAVIVWYGRTDLTPVSTDLSLVNSPSADLLGGCGPNVAEMARQASPILYVSKDDPPFLVVHGDRDGVVPVAQSRAFVDALRRVGAKADLIVLKGAGHGTEEFDRPALRLAIDAFLEEHLGLAPGYGERSSSGKPSLHP